MLWKWIWPSRSSTTDSALVRSDFLVHFCLVEAESSNPSTLGKRSKAGSADTSKTAGWTQATLLRWNLRWTGHKWARCKSWTLFWFGLWHIPGLGILLPRNTYGLSWCSARFRQLFLQPFVPANPASKLNRSARLRSYWTLRQNSKTSKQFCLTRKFPNESPLSTKIPASYHPGAEFSCDQSLWICFLGHICVAAWP